jgi:hypothetical protein
MPDIKLTTDGSMEQRIAKRLRNSGGEEANVTATHGTGPTRTITTNIHHSPVKNHGKMEEDEKR